MQWNKSDFPQKYKMKYNVHEGVFLLYYYDYPPFSWEVTAILASLFSNFLFSFFFVFPSCLFPCFFFLSIVPEEEVRAAEEKFEESKEICYNSMLNLIETADVSMQMYCFPVNTNLLLIVIPCLQLHGNCLI